MRRCLGLCILGLFLLSVFSTAALAAAFGAADSYRVTVQSIQIKRDSDDKWLTIATPNQQIDIVGDASGAQTIAASLLSQSSIPIGSYDNFKMVLLETMLVSGSAGGNFINSGASVTITGLNANAAKTSTWDQAGGALPLVKIIENGGVDSIAGTAGEATYSLDLAGDSDSIVEVYGQTDLATTIDITSTSVVSMSFTFDTATAVVSLGAGEMGAGATDVNANGGMVFMPPSTGTKFSITVDGVTTTITGGDMEFEF